MQNMAEREKKLYSTKDTKRKYGVRGYSFKGGGLQFLCVYSLFLL